MSEQNQNRSNPIGQATGNGNEVDGTKTRVAMTFHEPEVGQNNTRFRVKIAQVQADKSESVVWGTAFASNFGENGENVVFNVTTVARVQGPRKDQDGNFLDANGNVVESAEQAAQAMVPMINPKDEKPVYIPLAKLFTADKSKNDKPYPQTMLTGKVYTQDEGLAIAREQAGAKNAKSRGDDAKATAHFANSDKLVKETGKYISTFPDANILNTFTQVLNIPVRMPQPKVQNNNSAPTPG